MLAGERRSVAGYAVQGSPGSTKGMMIQRSTVRTRLGALRRWKLDGDGGKRGEAARVRTDTTARSRAQQRGTGRVKSILAASSQRREARGPVLVGRDAAIEEIDSGGLSSANDGGCAGSSARDGGQG